MIITDRDHVLDYLGLSERLDKALRFIADQKFQGFEDGEYLIDSRDVRVKIQHIQTKLAADAKLEAHNAFIDIQMPLEGTESVGWCFRGTALAETEAHPERDVWFYKGKVSTVELIAGELVILFPNDVHAPGLSIDSPARIRKAVFKIRIDEPI